MYADGQLRSFKDISSAEVGMSLEKSKEYMKTDSPFERFMPMMIGRSTDDEEIHAYKNTKPDLSQRE